jgi:hypothetical protein
LDRDILRLEQLRQQVEGSEFLSSYAYGYLDKGNPNEDQQREAEASIESYQQWKRDGLRQLGDLLRSLRATAPEIVAEWVGWHLEICERILASGPQRGPDGVVRVYAAQQALAEWQKVLAGTQDFVSISGYYLSEYSDEVAAAVAEAEKDLKTGSTA